MRQKWKPIWETNWKCPLRVYALLQIHVNTLNCLFLVALNGTWSENSERQWPLVCGHSHLSVLCWKGVPCTWKNAWFNSSPVRDERRPWATASQRLSDSFCAVCDNSTITCEVLSANCRHRKNTSHPSGTFTSLGPSFLWLQAPCTRKTFFPFCFLQALGPRSTGSAVKAIGSRRGHFNTSLEHSQFRLSISPRRQSGSSEKAYIPCHHIYQKDVQRSQLSKVFSLGWLELVTPPWAKRRRLDSYLPLPFHWRNWLPFPTCDLELFWSHICLQKDTPTQAITKVQQCPWQDANMPIAHLLTHWLYFLPWTIGIKCCSFANPNPSSWDSISSTWKTAAPGRE